MEEKIQKIDKTIEKLLKRGADPNVSEVPKPSIHLAIYTKDIPLVRLLLMYGASPVCQLYPNEGSLTPLHVLVLLKSAPEFVQICELLLNFGASPEEETCPEFFISEEEIVFLDQSQGRTPLQLLCMRPDIDFADPDANLIKIGLMLANVSNKRHFYKGHSCLTLAMYSGNLKFLQVLLETCQFDPNDVLGKNLGTALHVLVSTEFQKKTLYVQSIKMCDLLLENGADPMKEFKSPGNLLGTCIDYGYREIEAEKEARKASGKKDANKTDKSGKDKAAGRDHLKDHIRVVEYLREAANAKPYESKMIQKETPAAVKTLKKPSEHGSGVKVSKGSEATTEEGKDKGKSRSDEESRKKKEESGGASDDLKSRSKKSDGDAAAKIKRVEKRKGKERDAGKTPKKSKKVHEKDESMEKDKRKNLPKGLNRGKTESSLLKDKGRTSMKSLSNKPCSEMFPEKIRQKLLQMFGTCVNIDVNELLLPYVVLRDGELYYRFHGRGTYQKEQYSLI